MVLFDISDSKKYRILIRILKSYGVRIQKSIFECQIKRTQLKDLLASLDRLMSSERFYNPSDNIRLYKISGNCEVTVYGTYEENIVEENIFI